MSNGAMSWIGCGVTRWMAVAMVGLLLVVGSGCDGEQAEEEAAEQAAVDESEALEAVEQAGQRLARLSNDGAYDESLVERTGELAERYPQFMPALRLHGQALLYHGRAEAALESFEKALELDPDDAEMHHLIAGLAMGRGEYERAERHYAEAVELMPRRARYRVHLGVSQIEQGNYEQARQTLLEALQLDSTSDAARAALSDLYARQGQTRQALEQIRRAIELVEDAAGGQEAQRKVVYVRRRATLLRRDNQPEAALSVLHELDGEKQLEMGVAEEIAQTWAMLGRPEMAGEHYERVWLAEMENEQALAQAVEWFVRAEEAESAVALLEQLRHLNPEHAELGELERKVEALREG